MKRKFRIIKEIYSNESVEFSIQYTVGILGVFNCWVKIGVNKVNESIMFRHLYFYDLADVKYKFPTLEAAKDAVKWLKIDKSCSLGLDKNKNIVYLFDVKGENIDDGIKTYGAKTLSEAIKLFDKYSKVERIKVINKEIICV